MPRDVDSALAALDQAHAELEKSNVGSVTLAQPWNAELVTDLALGVFGFSLIAMALVTVLLWRSTANAQQVMRVFGIMLILTFSALLLIVGYDNDQLTPIIGLFGAIAGYLLGRDSRNGDDG